MDLAAKGSKASEDVVRTSPDGDLPMTVAGHVDVARARRTCGGDPCIHSGTSSCSILLDSKSVTSVPRSCWNSKTNPATCVHGFTCAVLTSQACTVVFSKDYPKMPIEPLLYASSMAFESRRATPLALQSFMSNGITLRDQYPVWMDSSHGLSSSSSASSVMSTTVGVDDTSTMSSFAN